MIRLDDLGGIAQYDHHFKAPELLPMSSLSEPNGLIKWWARRSVPVSQAGIAQMLQEAGFSNTTEYLSANLGLSLTDYYWIKPLDSPLRWKDVSLFSHVFRAGRLVSGIDNTAEDDVPHYSPNSSLQGDVEKTWCIKDGERCLVKGNPGLLSTQSLNEVFASSIYHRQGHDNYTEYSLIRIKGKPYDYGCYSRDFATEQFEYVSAYDIVCSEEKPNDLSTYEHFIQLCVRHGMDADLLRSDLEIQILTDFIISGHDRHLNNIGVLRDADTLVFHRLAPVFDSGESFFTGTSFPVNRKEMLSLSVNSFCAREKDLLAKVTDKGLLDLSKLPSVDEVRSFYEQDSNSNERIVNNICRCYELKIDILSDIQHGHDPYFHVFP